MNEYENNLRLCSKNTWNIDDIMEYEKCGKTLAYSLRKDAIRNGHAGVKYFSNLVNVDKYLAYRHETTREREIAIAKFGLSDPEKLIQVTLLNSAVSHEAREHDPR